MKYFAILPLLLITALLWGQPIDDRRMKRDIEVAENILSTLLEDVAANTFQSYQVDGTYLESYGLLFTIQNKFGGFAVAPRVILDGNRAISGRGEARELRGRVARGYSINVDSSVSVDQGKIKMLAETFLADYGHLLTQLPDNERICIKYSKSQTGALVRWNELAFTPEDRTLSTPGFTMVVPKKAVEDHRSGKIDRKALNAKIEYSETEAKNPETDRELILLNSIFNRLYQRDLSEGFYMRSNGRMEKIAGLGVLFSYRFSNKGEQSGLLFSEGQFQYHYNYFPGNPPEKMDALELGQKTEEAAGDEEDQNELEEEPDFDEFLEDFKSNVIEYGSTVRNLQGDEVLSFELRFPDCSDCDERPERVTITAKQALLDQYRKGQIELEEATDQLQVKY